MLFLFPRQKHKIPSSPPSILQTVGAGRHSDLQHPKRRPARQLAQPPRHYSINPYAYPQPHPASVQRSLTRGTQENSNAAPNAALYTVKSPKRFQFVQDLLGVAAVCLTGTSISPGTLHVPRIAASSRTGEVVLAGHRRFDFPLAHSAGYSRGLS